MGRPPAPRPQLRRDSLGARGTRGLGQRVRDVCICFTKP
jgi:hypothetical protein